MSLWRLKQLLRLKKPDPEAIAEAAEELFEAPRALEDPEHHGEVAEVLLPLLLHRDPKVRLAAVRGLAPDRFPAVRRALLRLVEGDKLVVPSRRGPDRVVPERDRVAEVRAAAEAVLDGWQNEPLSCIQCGVDPAKLAPDPTSDPNDDPMPRPLFCSEACAVAWALEEARHVHHLCESVGRWERGRANDCNLCLSAEVVGIKG